MRMWITYLSDVHFLGKFDHWLQIG